MRAAQSPSRAYLRTVNKGHAIFIDRADNAISNAGIDNLKLHYSSSLARVGWRREIKCVTHGVTTFPMSKKREKKLANPARAEGRREILLITNSQSNFGSAWK